MDITDADAKGVTLTTDYKSTSYNFSKAYAEGVTTLDGTQAASTKFNANGASSEADLVLTGVLNAPNTLTGGSGADTITGGDKNDHLKGNAGADVFIQSGGTDTIVDYTEGEDTIQLLGKATAKTVDSNVQLTNDYGTIIVLNGKGKDITTVLGGDNALASTNDELWGVSGTKDTFLFDGGKDTIRNYEENDVIKFVNNYSLDDLISGAPSVSDKNLVFTFDKANSLTISDIVNSGKTVTFDDGTSYSSDGKKLTRK